MLTQAELSNSVALISSQLVQSGSFCVIFNYSRAILVALTCKHTNKCLD